jgi:hypothetical protein
MQAISKGYKGVKLLLSLNADRLYATAALAGSLLLASWIASR